MTTVIDVLKSMRKHAEEANRNTTTTSSGAAESSSSPPPRNDDDDNDLSAVTLDTALTPLCHDAYLQRRILPLGPLDQVQVRKNTPRIFCFPMPDQRQSTVSAATIALRLAVQKTLARWPWLGGTVVSVGYDGWEPAAMREEDRKMLEIRYTVPPLDAVMVEGGGCGVFSAKVWSGFTSYARLAARGMPPKVLDCRQLTMRDEGVVVNTGLPALRVQANFIPGGLLLAVMDAHPAVDGVGGELVVEELARCLRPGAETMAAEEGRRIGAAAGVRDDNYMVSNNARGRQGANAAASLQSTPTVPEFELPDPEPPVTSRDDSISAGNPSARILTIRAATITSLKAAVMAELQATAAPGAFVSTHDVLSALIWTATMRARAPRLLLHQQDNNTQNDTPSPHDDLLTRFCTPVDARNKPAASSSPPLIAPTYPGNAVVFAFATMPMTELLGDSASTDGGASTATTTLTTTTVTTTIGSHIDSTTSRTHRTHASTRTSIPALARAALAIRRAISVVDGGFVQRRVEAWSGLEDPRQLLATLGAKMDLKESGVFVTSWVGFGADVEWSIPGVQSAAAAGGMKAEWVRKPWCEGEGGGVNVMPRRGGTRGGEEDWELLVRLGERDMERFLEVLGGVVVRVVE